MRVHSESSLRSSRLGKLNKPIRFIDFRSLQDVSLIDMRFR